MEGENSAHNIINKVAFQKYNSLLNQVINLLVKIESWVYFASLRKYSNIQMTIATKDVIPVQAWS